MTFAALALSTPSWSANLAPCSNDDAGAMLAKIRQYVLPAPNSPQHRWLVAKAGEGWTITEYSGLRIFVRCKPVSKADELNAVQYGEVAYQYEARRTTRFPELTSAGLQWDTWSEWKDSPESVQKAQKARPGSLEAMVNGMAAVFDSAGRRISFRKHKGKFQFEWEYDQSSEDSALMPAADVQRFLRTADTEAAKLRVAEADAAQAKRAQEEAAQVRDTQQMSTPGEVTRREAGRSARITFPANPDDFYPPGSKRREEQGSPVVQVCVGPGGKLVREPEVTDTSGFPDLDGAAIKVAKATRYVQGTENGTPLAESCIKFKIKFTLNNN